MGPAEALARLRDLESIASGLAGRDLFALYERSVAHDGVFEEDIAGSGRYYAYLLYELKGTTPEDREAKLAAALEDLVSEYGKDAIVSRIPARIAGRQVTESLTFVPSPTTTPPTIPRRAWPMPRKWPWTSCPRPSSRASGPTRSASSTPSAGRPCGYAIGTASLRTSAATPTSSPRRPSPWSNPTARSGRPRSRWRRRVLRFRMRTDGEYPADVDNELGRYYAYVRAALKGQASGERRDRLLAALPDAAVRRSGPRPRPPSSRNTSTATRSPRR